MSGATVVGRILAIDWGDRRIGLASCDELGMLASPLGVVTRRAGKRPPIAELLRHADDTEAALIIFGLPLNPSGDDTERSLEVREVAARMATRTTRPIRLVDERFTTAAALRSVREQGGSTRGRKGDVDALAATILLEQVLNAARQGIVLGEAVAARPTVGDIAHDAP
jgi:putative Holliday junction resolvase